jgi:hypothetical protein
MSEGFWWRKNEFEYFAGIIWNRRGVMLKLKALPMLVAR